MIGDIFAEDMAAWVWLGLASLRPVKVGQAVAWQLRPGFIGLNCLASREIRK